MLQEHEVQIEIETETSRLKKKLEEVFIQIDLLWEEISLLRKELRELEESLEKHETEPY